MNLIDEPLPIFFVKKQTWVADSYKADNLSCGDLVQSASWKELSRFPSECISYHPINYELINRIGGEECSSHGADWYVVETIMLGKMLVNTAFISIVSI